MSSTWSPPPPPLPTHFAKLIPANEAAKKAFSRVAGKIKADTGGKGEVHVGRYIIVESEEEEVVVGGWVRRSGSEEKGESESDDGNEGVEEVRNRVWTGYYVLDFAIPPRRPNIGWILGGGRLNECAADIDILLTESEQAGGVRSQHASLAHNPTSGALMITAVGDSAVVINGTETLKDGQQLIYKRRTSIELGNLKYILELEPISDQDYRSLLTSYRIEHGLGANDYPSNLTVAPSEWDRILPDYVIKNPVGHGVTGIVSAALHRATGNCVAIKTFRRYTDRDDAHLEKAWKIAETIGWHPNICQLISIISPAAEDPERGYRACGVDEAFLVYTPLASWTVEKLLEMDKHVTSTQCIGLLQGFLDGIEYLHSKKIMHRDIKPSNLTVLSLAPPRGQLIDFGHAIHSLIAHDTDAGTPGWRAPELADLISNPKSRAEYDERIDVFSLGISMYRLFCQVRRRWWDDKIREGDVVRMGLALGKLDMLDGVAGLLGECMEWDPGLRLRAKQAKERLKGLCEQDEIKGGREGGQNGYLWGGEEGADGGEGGRGQEGGRQVFEKKKKKGRRSAWR